MEVEEMKAMKVVEGAEGLGGDGDVEGGEGLGGDGGEGAKLD